MLVLSRATKESIVIGGVVTVKVIDVRGTIRSQKVAVFIECIAAVCCDGAGYE